MFEHYKDFSNPLEWMVATQHSTEQRWFMETYYPNYETIMAIARDLLDDRWTPDVDQYFATSAATGKATNHLDTGERLYGVKAASIEYGVSEEWIRRHVVGMMRGVGDPDTFRQQLRLAIARYGKDLAWQHPLMPAQRILTRCHEFIPADWWVYDDVARQVMRWWDGSKRVTDKCLNTQERQSVSLAVNAYKATSGRWGPREPKPDWWIEQFMDDKSLERERLGRYDGRGEVH